MYLQTKGAPTFYYIFHVSECRAKLVDIALANGKIYDGEGFKYIKESFKDGTLHFIGLLSDGGVHSRLDQLQVSLFHIFQQNVVLVLQATIFSLHLCCHPVSVTLSLFLVPFFGI